MQHREEACVSHVLRRVCGRSHGFEPQAKQGSRSCSQGVAHQDHLIPRIVKPLRIRSCVLLVCMDVAEAGLVC